MAIEHDFFGILESGPDGSLFWSETIEFGDQTVDVDLTAPDETDVADEALNVAAAMITGLESIDLAAREAMVTQLSDRTSEVTEFVLQQQESLGEDLEDFLPDISGDTAIDIIKALRLMSATFIADERGGEEPFLVLEFALDVDAYDEVLLVNIAFNGSILTVTSGQ